LTAIDHVDRAKEYALRNSDAANSGQ